MTMTDVYYDPYDREIDADPYPVYARLTISSTSTPSVVSQTSSGGSSTGRSSVPLAAQYSSSSRRISKYRLGL